MAQHTDFGVWSSVELSKKFDNNVKVGFEEDFRLRNDLLTTDKFESTLDVGYELTSHLTTGISYTLINYYHPRDDNHEHNFWEIRHRLNVYGEGALTIGRFEVSLKERVQYTYRMLDSLSSAKINPKYTLRSKLNVSYNIKGLPLEPFVFAEFFNALNDDKKSFKFEKYRVSGGIKYAINKKTSVKVGYLFTSETNSDEGERAGVLTIGLGYKL